MATKQQIEVQRIDTFVLSQISILANKYSIHPDINIEARTINLTGGSDQDQSSLAKDIANTLQRYST